MQAIEALLTRRSIRKYTQAPIPAEILEKLFLCTLAAPSAKNQKPLHLVVIQEKKTLSQIAAFHPHAAMCKEAALGILICSDTKIETTESFCLQDGAAAAENLLVAAHALGLGAVWVSVHPKEERIASFVRLLGLPENILPIALIVLGHPNEKKTLKEPPEKSRLHFEKW
ncbi:MAG: nitroreductase family protein [Parachlamydiales bacterium]|jgi:nitroreductase